VLHPNTLGYRHYRDRYLDFLRDRFAVVGNWKFAPKQLSVNVKDQIPFVLEWKHPTNWHDLTSLELRAVNGDDTAFWVRWDELENTFRLVNPQTGRLGPAQDAGGGAQLETSFAALDLGGSMAKGSGPTGPSVAVTFDLSFKTRASGREWRLEVLAIDDSGAVQQFEEVGTVVVNR
jgi:hypothetical protein